MRVGGVRRSLEYFGGCEIGGPMGVGRRGDLAVDLHEVPKGGVANPEESECVEERPKDVVGVVGAVASRFEKALDCFVSRGLLEGVSALLACDFFGEFIGERCKDKGAKGLGCSKSLDCR